MVATGVLLFYAIPVRNYQNIFFRMKMVMLVFAMFNIWYFHTRTERSVAHWDIGGAAAARGAHRRLCLDCLWFAIVVAGRMIAYNWFDCDIQPQPAFVNWAAGSRPADAAIESGSQ